jgi:hypothetical protein
VAKACACCGSPLSWSQARVAHNAAEILARLPVAVRYAGVVAERDDANVAIAANEFRNAGQGHANTLHRAAHGGGRSRDAWLIPSVKEWADWCKVVDGGLLPALKTMDPHWVKWWTDQGRPPADLQNFDRVLGQRGLTPPAPGQPPLLPEGTSPSRYPDPGHPGSIRWWTGFGWGYNREPLDFSLGESHPELSDPSTREFSAKVARDQQALPPADRERLRRTRAESVEQKTRELGGID